MSKQNGNNLLPVAGKNPVTAPEFTPVMMFDGVSCFGCKLGAQAQQPIICRTPSELIAQAKRAHLGTATPLTPCKLPRLVIEYSTALIDTVYLDQLADETLIV